MIVVLHVIIALASTVYTTYVYLFPSKSKLNLAYSLVALTIASGTYLVLTKPSQLISACITGLIYLGLVLPTIVSTRSKLARLVS